MSDDVLITPASRKIEFKDSGGNVDGTIQLDSSGNLVLTSSVGLLIGDLDADIHIGDGSNVVDMVFDFAGSIYSAANQDLTIGKKSLGGNDILIESPSPVRVSTASGYIDVGPANTSWSHFSTDRGKYYFNKPIVIDGGNTNGDAYLISSYNTEDFVIATNNGTEDRITVKQATGNVGIGVTDPDKTLEVNSGSTNLGGIKITGSGVNTSLTIDNTGTNGGKYRMSVTSGSHGDGTNKLLIQDNNTSRLTLDSSGRIGIGTTSPNQKLTIEGTMSLKEQASANADTAAYGQLWVKTATPNQLYFTTDAGDDIQLTSGTSIAGGGGGAVDSIANFANNRVLTASDADSINGEANLVFDGTNLGIGEDDPANLLEIRGASTAGTYLGHIMLTGDSSTVGQGPQIVFSESGSGSNWAGASIGHVRTGSGSMGDLIFSTRQSSGNANTVPTEMMRLVGGTSPEITMATNISSTSKSAFNLMQKFYFQRSSMGTGTVDLRVPCGGDGSANPNNYPMPRAGKVVALTLHYYGGTIATGVETDVWEIRKYSGGSETTLDVSVVRQTLTNPVGSNYNITVELASPMNVAAGDWLGIRRDVSGGSVTHVSGVLYVSFAG